MVATPTLLITNCLADMGGGEVAILRHIDHSSLLPDRITVAVLNQGPFQQHVQARGVRWEFLGRNGRDGRFPGWGETLQIAWKVSRLVRKLGISHVLCYTVPDLQAALLARSLVRFRLSWRSQAEITVQLPQGAKDQALNQLVRKCRNHVDWIITTTERDAELLLDNGAPAERVRTIYLGVEDCNFDAHPVAAGERRPLRVVISGRLVPDKRHRLFLQVFAQVAADFPDAEAWVVGGGAPEYLAELEQEADRLSIRGRTKFWGHCPDAIKLVKQCDVAVLCSEREPFGLVVIEAMAAGIPVIASDVQGPREILRNGETGYLIGPSDPSAYAAALAALLANADLRRRIGEAGREVASARFRVRTNTTELERLLFSEARATDAGASRLTRATP
jgi:glycosyltransferase involved in cell wall biosynthesis